MVPSVDILMTPRWLLMGFVERHFAPLRHVSIIYRFLSSDLCQRGRAAIDMPLGSFEISRTVATTANRFVSTLGNFAID